MQQFQYLQLETSNICNMKCEYCFSQNLDHERGQMSIEDIEQVLKQIGHRPMNDIRPFLNGDPLTEVRLPEILKLIKTYTGARTCIYTNGTITRNRDFLINPNLDDVKFTISAATPETYAIVHRRPFFDIAVRNLEWFAQNKRPDQTLEVHLVTTDHNYHELDAYPERFKQYHPWVSPLALNEGNMAAQKASAISRDAFKEDLWKRFGTGKMPCVLYNNLTIDWRGRYMQCCNFYDSDQWNYGSIHDLTVDEAWAHRQANRLNNPICNSCNLRKPNFTDLLT